MYADFKSILKDMESDVKDRGSNKSNTDKINEHVPSGYCVYSKFAYRGVEEHPLEHYKGENCVEKFCEYVLNEPRRFHDKFSSKSMKKLTSEQWRDYKAAEKCHTCMKPFKEEEKIWKR